MYERVTNRRKFRSQTSDNMDRWKAEQGRGREKRKIRRKKRKKKEDADAWKGRKVAFFQWFGSPEGRNVGSLKRRVRSQLARWEMKNCTPLWREAHLQVKMHKTWCSEHFWKMRCQKSARRCGAKHISKLTGVRTTFGSYDVEKVHAVVARSTFPSQNVQNNTPCTDHFWRFRCRFAWGLCTLSKVTKTWGFCSISKNDGRHATFEEDLQRCIFVAGAVQKTCSWEIFRRSGRWFPETGCILEYQMCRFAKMILRDRCSTSYDLAKTHCGDT